MQSKVRILILFFFIWFLGIVILQANPCLEENTTEMWDDCVEQFIPDLQEWPSAKLLIGSSINFTPTLTFTTTNPTCNGSSDGTITVNPPIGGLFNYLWSDGQTTQTAISLSAGYYSVEVDDGWDYYYYGDTTLFDPPLFLVSISNDEDVPSCSPATETTAIITGSTGPYNFLWNTGETTQTIDPNNASNVSVTVTDSNGCQMTAAATYLVLDAPTFEVWVNNHVSCNGLSDGSASVENTGGNPPYTYDWSNGETGRTATALSAGIHYVTISGGSGACFTGEVLQVVINQNAALQVNVQTTPNSATANASGGTGNYTYQWTNGSTSQTVSNLAVGAYWVSVIDENNCQTSADVFINGFSISGNILDCNGDPSSQVTVSLTGDATVVTTTDANGYYSFSSLNQGNYTVTPSRNTAITGLSIIDVILALRHIQGTPITDDCSLIAADVNENCSISVTDLILIQRIIQGNATSFPSGNSWRFIAENYTSTGSVPCNFPESLDFNSLAQNEVNQNFNATRMGDVNTSGSN